MEKLRQLLFSLYRDNRTLMYITQKLLLQLFFKLYTLRLLPTLSSSIRRAWNFRDLEKKIEKNPATLSFLIVMT